MNIRESLRTYQRQVVLALLKSSNELINQSSQMPIRSVPGRTIPQRPGHLRTGRRSISTTKGFIQHTDNRPHRTAHRNARTFRGFRDRTTSLVDGRRCCVSRSMYESVPSEDGTSDAAIRMVDERKRSLLWI